MRIKSVLLRLALGSVAALGLALSLGALAPADANARAPYPKKGDSSPHHGVRDAKSKPVQGIDISKWQKDIDWDKVKAAGTRFAFIKATEGGDHLDENFRENWAGAKQAGVPRGAYHFIFWCRPIKDQIRWFIRNVPREANDLPPVIDAEWNNASRCPRTTPDKARAKVREMARAFEAHYGKKPVIYTDINFHEDVFEGTNEFNHLPFWIRSTAAKPHERYENRPWAFWQFTTTGRVPGITGDVDRNAFYGSESEFKAWREGRFDIGTRKFRNGPAVANSKPEADEKASIEANERPRAKAKPVASRPAEQPRTAARPAPRPRIVYRDPASTGSLGVDPGRN
ncbi:MAG: glycoside hydrolase family 25 protein [Bosea sp. (in: a-proteobacteria)]